MTRHFRTLDGMRGVAALAVVFLHVHFFLGQNIMPRGYLAVDLFFALSGLVLAHAYGERLSAGMTVGRFMFLRLARLYPLYLLGTAIGIAFFLAATRFGTQGDVSPGGIGLAIGASLLMLPSPVVIEPRGWLQPFNIAGWSLFFELAVNLLLVLIWRRLTTALLAGIILVSGVVLVWQTLGHGNADLGAEWATVPLGIARTIFSFFAGIALYRLPRPAERRTGWAWLLPTLLVPVFMPGPEVGALYDLACILFLFPALIYLGAMIEPRRENVFAFLGIISFAIYALHSPIMPIVSTALKLSGATPAMLAPWGGILLVAALVLFSWAADLIYDRPVRRWLGQSLRLPRTAAA